MSVMLERPLTAPEVLARYWDDSVPVNPVSIADAMGVLVLSMDEWDVEGEFYFDNKNQPTILIRKNSATNKQRMRFTIAHELGHYCLKHGARKRDTSLFGQNRDYAERQADEFAAQLLMPADALGFAVKEYGLTSVDDLAKLFDVSSHAMHIRLQRLGMI